MSKNKLANEKTKAEIEKTRIEVSKIKMETWLGIANILLTALVGIGVALFINYRDERVQKELVQLQAEANSQTQKELLELQADMARQMNLAHLEISRTCLYYTSCDGSIRVKNLGPADAKNLKIVVSISGIRDPWQTSITDIGKFKIKRFPSSFTIDYQETKVDVLYPFQEVPGNNAFVFSVPELRSGNDFQLLLELDSTVAIKQYEMVRPITLYFNQTQQEYVYLSNALSEYLEGYFAIADFRVEGDCDNCEGDVLKTSFVVSTLAGWGYSSPPASGNEGWNRELHATHYMPEGMDYVPPSSPLFLEVALSDTSQRLVVTETTQR